MQQSKSPKSLAYARKAQSGKNSIIEQHKKGKRNSSGNIYEQLLQQIHPQANSYIRQLVNKNQKQSNQPQNSSNIHSRRKSYAQIVIDSSSKQKQKIEKIRQQRQTLCKPKFQSIQSNFLQQITPKNLNGSLTLNKKSSSKNINNSISNICQSNIMINSFKKQSQKISQSFLDNLNTYLYQLNQIPQNYNKNYNNNNQKLSQTLKINSNQNQSYKLLAKIQQSSIKIKQLKVKTYYQERQINKFIKKQQKMKNSLFQMLGQIKHLNAQLTYQKKQKKKLQRIIDNFQMKKNQPERKTIGKYYNINLQQFQNDFNTQYQDKDYDSSFRQILKNNNNKGHHPIKIYDQDKNTFHGILDSQKIQKLFRSNYNSDQNDD